MNRRTEGEAARTSIMTVLFDHQQTGSADILGVSEIAQRTGLPVGELTFHLRLLCSKGLAHFEETHAGGGIAWLTPSGEQVVREGGPSTVTFPGAGTVIHAPNSTFHSVATNIGGHQQVNVGTSGNLDASLQQLIEQLQREIRDAGLGVEDKQNALIDVDQMAAETRRSQPRLERIRDSVASLSQILTTATPALSAILTFLRAQGIT